MVGVLRQSRLFWLYLATCTALVAVQPLLPLTLGDLNYAVVTSSAFVPMIHGYLRVRSTFSRPWLFLIAAAVIFAIGSWVWFIGAHGPPSSAGLLDVSRIFSTLGKVLILGGLIGVVIRRGRNDIGGILDATIISGAVSGVLWAMVLMPAMRADGDGPVAQLVMLVSVLILTEVLGTIVRLLQTAVRHFLSLSLMSLGLGLSLGAIVLAEALDIPFLGPRPPWTDMALMLSFAAIGSVGLERDSPELMTEGPTPGDDLGVGRLFFLGASIASVPVIAGLRQLLGYPVDGLFIATSGAVLVALAMIRIGLLSGQRMRAERALAHQATHDELTGLPNRRAFVGHLAAELGRLRHRPPAPETARTQPERPVLLFCDLNGFKQVNDDLGHAAGDRLLVEVGSRMRQSLRARDTVSRFGGDEFVILLWTDPEEDMSVIIRLCDEVHRPIDIDGVTVQVGMSVGAASVVLEPPTRQTRDRPLAAADGGADSETLAEEFIRRADVAMYESKRRHHSDRPGRGIHVSWWEDLSRTAPAQLRPPGTRRGSWEISPLA